MSIIIKDNNRILIKENAKEIMINDGDIIQYTGIYYKHSKNEISNLFEIKTTFIGIVVTEKSSEVIQGIYVKPIYIWSMVGNEWMKINDYECPVTKYFLYPHLLILPEFYYNSKPLYFLHTCENKSLSDFNNITKEFSLGKSLYN